MVKVVREVARGKLSASARAPTAVMTGVVCVGVAKQEAQKAQNAND